MGTGFSGIGNGILWDDFSSQGDIERYVNVYINKYFIQIQVTENEDMICLYAFRNAAYKLVNFFIT